MSEKLFKEAIEAILKGDTDKATDVAKRGLDEGLDPLALMDQDLSRELIRWVIYLRPEDCFSPAGLFGDGNGKGHRNH